MSCRMWPSGTRPPRRRRSCASGCCAPARRGRGGRLYPNRRIALRRPRGAPWGTVVNTLLSRRESGGLYLREKPAKTQRKYNRLACVNTIAKPSCRTRFAKEQTTTRPNPTLGGSRGELSTGRVDVAPAREPHRRLDPVLIQRPLEGGDRLAAGALEGVAWPLA